MSNEGESEQVVELHSTQPRRGGGGSISHCSLTGKINRDLLTHRECTPPTPHPSLPLSRTQREALGLIFFPGNTGNSRNSQVDKSLRAHPPHPSRPPTCCSFSYVCWSARGAQEASIQMMICISPTISLHSRCHKACSDPNQRGVPAAFPPFSRDKSWKLWVGVLQMIE